MKMAVVVLEVVDGRGDGSGGDDGIRGGGASGLWSWW